METTVDDTADGKVVGDQDGDSPGRSDRVESDSRTDVDEREKSGDGERDGDGRKGNVPVGRDVGKPAVAGQDGVSCERPDLAGSGHDFGNGASGEHYDDDSGYSVDAGVRLHDIELAARIGSWYLFLERKCFMLAV